MDASEYIEAVTSQMRCKRARAMVAKELSDHIEDQTEGYLEEGMPLLEAKAEAVRQMGDAVEVGTQMDALHRPRLDKRMLLLIGIFSIVACFLQTIVLKAEKSGGNLFISSKMVPFQVLFGLVLMVVILYLDYTLLEKCSVLLWIGIFLVPLLGQNINILGVTYFVSHRIGLYAAFALAPPLYAAVVYHDRSKRYIGIFFSLLWLFAGMVLCREITNSLFETLQLGFICLFILSYAIARGWYGVRRAWTLGILWTALLGGCLGSVVHVFLYGAEYQRARMKAFLGFWDHDAYHDMYVTSGIRNSLGEISLWGRGNGWVPVGPDGVTYGLSSDTSFYILLNRIGAIPCILILFGLLAMLVLMAAGVSRQKNVLGGLVGAACLLGLLVPTVVHLLCNLSLLPYGNALIPFLYPGWVANEVNYTSLGFYLSFYRNTDVVA